MSAKLFFFIKRSAGQHLCVSLTLPFPCFASVSQADAGGMSRLLGSLYLLLLLLSVGLQGFWSLQFPIYHCSGKTWGAHPFAYVSV